MSWLGEAKMSSIMQILLGECSINLGLTCKVHNVPDGRHMVAVLHS